MQITAPHKVRLAPLSTCAEAQANPRRPRSAGALSAAGLQRCRAQGMSLAYDPVQIGWVPAGVEDDLAMPADPWPSPAPVPAEAATRHRLQLRPWQIGDLATYRTLLDDSEVWRHMPEAYPAPLTRDMAADLLAVAALEGHHEVRAVDCDGITVGQVRLLFDTVAPGRAPDGAEISYWLGRAHWCRGIGGDLVTQATRDAFAARPALMRLHARVRPDNRASARALERAGYRRAAAGPDAAGWLIYEIGRGGA